MNTKNNNFGVDWAKEERKKEKTCVCSSFYI